jgi:hypothetical protein
MEWVKYLNKNKAQYEPATGNVKYLGRQWIRYKRPAARGTF